MQSSTARRVTRESTLAEGIRGERLAAVLAARIRTGGPIPFAEFMRECLYHPEHGYYSRLQARRRGDYYTSVDVHAIFARLIARQLAEMWELLGSPQPFLAVESGAGVGRLAAPRFMPRPNTSLWSVPRRAARNTRLRSLHM